LTLTGTERGDIANTVGFSLITGACINIVYVLLMSAPETTGLCGPDNVLMTTSPLISLMPVNYMILLAGVVSYGRPYVEALIQRGFRMGDLKRLLLGMVISGGSVYSQGGKYCIRFYGKDFNLHRIFADLSYSIYSTAPCSVRVNSRGTYMTQLYSKCAVSEMREFSPELNSRRGGVPTIGYILEGNIKVKAEAVRLIMSSSGWVTCSFGRAMDGVTLYPRLGLGSVLPVKLAYEYRQLASDIAIRFDVFNDRRYPDSGYLATSYTRDMERFRVMGGFVDGTTVKKGTFSGMDRNGLLRALLSTKGKRFGCVTEACDYIRLMGNDTTFELKAYLDRIMLG